VVELVLHVHNVKAAGMALAVDNGTNTTHVVAASDKAEVAGVELDVVNNLARLDLNEDGVVGLDSGVRVADGTAVVGDEVGNTLGAGANLLDPAELELRMRRKRKKEEN